MAYYNILSGVLRGLGDSISALVYLIVASVTNIVLDLVFVAQFKMGVAGVAWATFLCQGVSCVLAVGFVLRRLKGVETDEKSHIFSFPIFCRIAVIAIPSILQQSFISVGNIVIQGVINSFGSSVMAGYSASVKLNNLVITSLTTLGNGISNFTAQNLGAQKPDRIRSGFRAGLYLVWALCVPLTVLYFFAGAPLVKIFVDNPTQKALATGVQFLHIVAPFYVIVASKIVADGVLRGAGKMGPFMASTFTDLLLRVALAFVLSRTFEETGIWLSWPIGWTVATVMSLLFYRFARLKPETPAEAIALETETAVEAEDAAEGEYAEL